MVRNFCDASRGYRDGHHNYCSSQLCSFGSSNLCSLLVGTEPPPPYEETVR
ncbi:unnamed protein product [Larinioides sclopetarius]|uniref:Uncharacterized protein n=1 Tax=Larinioides sclopetarius TaxID=280406 RepID=A0AAV2AC70_9ARAC